MRSALSAINGAPIVVEEVALGWGETSAIPFRLRSLISLTTLHLEFHSVGRWRSKELFVDGRLTCRLSHVRHGNPSDTV